jgi:hypothetical protein
VIARPPYLALRLVGLAIAALLWMLLMPGCTVRYEAMLGGTNPGLTRTTLSLFSDDASTFSCATTSQGATSVTLGGHSAPNEQAMALLERMLAIAGPPDPRRGVAPPADPQASPTACTPFAHPVAFDATGRLEARDDSP